MFDSDFDPYEILMELQDNLNQVMVNQEQLAKNYHYLYQTLVAHQKQLNTLTSLDTLFNTKLDLIREDLEQQIMALKPHMSESK